MTHINAQDDAIAPDDDVSRPVASRARRFAVAAVAVATTLLLALGSAPASYADDPASPDPSVSASADPSGDPSVDPSADPSVDPGTAQPPDTPAAPTTAAVTFNANGGKVSTTHKSVACGAKYGTLPTPTRTGYTFGGWYTAASGGSKVSSTSKAPTESAVTLYAHWSGKYYTARFAANGGSVSKSSKSVRMGASYGSLPKPTRYGYNFTGWFTKASGGVQITASSKVNKAYTHTLYAHWSAKQHTVHFMPRSGTVTPGTKTVKYASAYGALPSAKRTGYNFSGWYTKPVGGSRIYASNRVHTTTTQYFYAHWAAKMYTVKFSGNGGSVGTKSKTVSYNQKFGSLPTPKRSGYKFTGWFTDPAAGSHISASTVVKITGATTLYAHWAALPDHWVDVDIATQTLKMMDHNTVVATYPVSTGKPSTPTPTGTFHVYAHTAKQSMQGYANVKWCTWYKGNYAIHTAYWHNEFGIQPVSHGCVNMREADAKVMYYWLYNGAKVYIHGKWGGKPLTPPDPPPTTDG